MKRTMKQLLAATTLLYVTAGSANADVIESFRADDGADEFVTRYVLRDFDIAEESTLLDGMGQVRSGTIDINDGRNELRLRLARSVSCDGQICPAVMPTDTEIVLPIDHMAPDACGGLQIVAESEAGRVVVNDTNGNRCGGQQLLTVIKRVQVTVTEQGREGEQVSRMTGALLLAR